MITNEFEQNFDKNKQVLICLIPHMVHLRPKDWERIKNLIRKD